MAQRWTQCLWFKIWNECFYRVLKGEKGERKEKRGEKEREREKKKIPKEILRVPHLVQRHGRISLSYAKQLLSCFWRCPWRQRGELVETRATQLSFLFISCYCWWVLDFGVFDGVRKMLHGFWDFCLLLTFIGISLVFSSYPSYSWCFVYLLDASFSHQWIYSGFFRFKCSLYFSYIHFPYWIFFKIFLWVFSHLGLSVLLVFSIQASDDSLL